MLFEYLHSQDDKEFALSSSSTLSFPIHLHRSFEFCYQEKGATEVNIGGREYLLKGGQAVLIFPFQLHSYRAVEEGKVNICIFSSNFVPEFYKANKLSLPVDNFLEWKAAFDLKQDNIYLQQAVAYLICGTFDRDRVYEPLPNYKEENVLVQLLLFAEKNYLCQCTLRDAAAAVGYDYAYISKFFKRKINLSFNSYINLLRVSDSRYLLETTEKSITEIKDLCGFQCLRTFNREFYKLSGCTPSEYRKKKVINRSAQ